MKLEVIVGALLALLSSGLLNVSFSLQHRAVNEIIDLSLRRPLRSLRALFGHPRWLIAYFGGWLGWGIYILALRFSPLSVVQAVASAGLPFLAGFAHRSGHRLSFGERLAVVIGAAGTCLVFCTLGEVATGTPASAAGIFIVVGAGIVLSGIIAILGRLSGWSGASLGVASGICYAVADVATKGAVDGTGAVLIPLFLLMSLFGFVSLQLSFQRGGLMQTAGLSSLITSLVPIVAGVVLYHERLPHGPWGIVQALGFSLSILAAVLLGATRRVDVARTGEAATITPA